MRRSHDLSRDLCDVLLRTASHLVPGDLRADWLREWRAEVAWRLARAGGTGRTRARVALRCLGAFAHAGWLRWDRWRLEMLGQDLKYAVRGLLRRPGFTAVAVLTLALGIGANATIFSAAHAVLLRPLPYPEPERLVRLYKTPVTSPDWLGGTTTPPDFTDWQEQARAFTAMGAYVATSMPLTGEGDPAQLPSAAVTGGFFSALEVPALHGRTVSRDDDAMGGPDVVVLSHSLWQRQFGARSDIIGRRVVLASVSREVVGVMPAGFDYPSQTEIWVPLRFTAEVLATQRGAHYLSVVGRLQPGATTGRAREEMRTIAARLAEAHPRTNADSSSTVHPLREALVGHVRPGIIVALASVSLVLLIVCVNVANLVMTRAAGRARELAVRAAVGADRSRLMRGLLIETLVLAVAGGVAGTLLAAWAVSAISLAAPGMGIPLLEQTRVDGPILLFVAGLSLLTALAVGLGPAWHASRTRDVVLRLREAGTTNAGRPRARHALIVLETAMAVVLLVGAGLLVRSFSEMLSVRLGFETGGVQTFALTLPDARYPEPHQRGALVESLLTRIRTHPDVQAAGAVTGLPLSDYNFGFSASTRDGTPLPDDEQDRLTTQLRIVTPAYLAALEMRIVDGRGFTDGDTAGATPVVLLSESAARLIWPGVSPLGRHITIGTRLGLGGDRVGGEVVGVVADIHDLNPTVAPRQTIYATHAQFPVSTVRVAVKSVGDPDALLPFLRATVAELDADLPMFQVQTLDQIARASLAQPRLLTLLLSIFAAVAVALAAIGLYGVLAHAVGQRTREIGVRMALGARRAEVVNMIVGQAGRLAAVGIAAGILVSAGLSRLLTGMLFGVRATDPLTYAAVVGGVAIVALVAAGMPAWRASRIDPVAALRQG